MPAENIWQRVKNYDWFALGPSVLVYYCAGLFLVPLLVLAGVRVGFTLQEHTLSWRPVLIALVGALCLAAGYWLVPVRRTVRRLPNPWKYHWRPGRAKAVFWTLFGAGLADKIIRLSWGGYSVSRTSAALAHSPFYSALGFLSYLDSFAVALAVAFALRPPGGQKRYWSFLAQGAVVLEVLYAFPSCSRTLILAPLLLWLMAEWYLGKRSWLALGVFGIIIAAILSWGNVCRNPLALRSYKVLDEQLGVHSGQLPVLAADSVISRVNQMGILDMISRDILPRQGFSFLRDTVVSLGPPRFLWPSKPSIAGGGHVLGMRLGVLNPSDYGTSIGATLVGSWYLAFGLAGVVIGMFLSGAFLRALYEYFIFLTARSAAAVAAYGVIWMHALKSVESSLAPVLAGGIKLFLVLLVIAFFARDKEKPAA